MSRSFLSERELAAALGSFAPGGVVHVVRIRYKNQQAIRTRESLRIEELRQLLETSMAAGHQPGGDLELEIPALGKTLVGHHDGLYWLERAGNK